MGLFDIFKGILPDSLIKVVNNIDNRKIEIKDSRILVGREIITDKEVIDRFFNKLEELNCEESLPFQLVHKELADPFIQYENISNKQKERLRELKEILPQEDVECLLMAFRAVSSFNEGDSLLGTKIKDDLERKYPRKGKRVYNLINAGYFDEMLLPFIEIFKSEYGLEQYKQKYRTFYFGLINFFPIAIFVGNTLDEEKVKGLLLERLFLKDIPFIRLHAIGQNNIQKIGNVVEELGIDKKYSIEDKKFITSTGLKAQIYEIKIKSIKVV